MADCVYVVDKRYYESIQKAFGRGRVILPSVSCRAIAEPVSCHPDMVLFPAGGGTVVCAPEVYEAYAKILSPFGVKLVQGKKALSVCYPEDVAYNILRAGNFAFALWGKADEMVLAQVRARGITTVSVAQGYARCSATSFADCLISADPSICAAAKSRGLSVLQLSSGGILLPGYEYGFIGGASGAMAEDTLAFFGDLSMHPEGEEIRSFVLGHGFSIEEVPGQPLTDVGTILRIDL